jgi:nucleotide-binding universal stress UspA family protein
MSTRVDPGSIVVAVDGSDQAERAVRWAAEQARLENRRLAVVSVALPDWFQVGSLPAPGMLHPSPEADPAETARVLAENGVKTAEAWRPGITAAAHALRGETREVLTTLSESVHLLVLGSRGRGPVATRLLGSVSAHVAKAASCPVVVCRPDSPGTVRHGVLVGADGTPESRAVLELAFRLASQRDLPLTVLHSAWDVVAAASDAGLLPARDITADHLLLLSESVAGFAEKFPDVQVTRLVSRGFAEEVLAADSTRWDAVVVGRHSRSAWSRYVTRSIATEVLEHAHTTVAIVPLPARD